MNRIEAKLSGFGGQGIILAGFILGQAASIFEGKNATLTQDYGPEARGGSCSAQVVISDEPASYPYATNPSVLVAMSQEAYSKNTAGINEDVLILIDENLVTPEKGPKNRILSIPATQIAQGLGRSAVANIVMLGFLTATSGIVQKEAMKQSVLASVPKGTEELNTKAFESGYNYGVDALQKAKRSTS